MSTAPFALTPSDCGRSRLLLVAVPVTNPRRRASQQRPDENTSSPAPQIIATITLLSAAVTFHADRIFRTHSVLHNTALTAVDESRSSCVARTPQWTKSTTTIRVNETRLKVKFIRSISDYFCTCSSKTYKLSLQISMFILALLCGLVWLALGL